MSQPLRNTNTFVAHVRAVSSKVTKPHGGTGKSAEHVYEESSLSSNVHVKHFSDEVWSVKTIFWRRPMERYVLTKNGWEQVDTAILKGDWDKYLKKGRVDIDKST